MSELAIIIPVYNEEGAIERVLDSWILALDQIDVNYSIHVYNDGSKDNTKVILDRYADKHERIQVCHKPNSGHGSTILQGYRECSNAEWIFQIDSDDEIASVHFKEVWSMRKDADFVIGYRVGRDSPLARRVVSAISRFVVNTFYGRGVIDVNCPFRLMRGSVFSPYFSIIPADTFAPNVILSGIAAAKGMTIRQLAVNHINRQTGEVSIKKWKLFKASVKSFKQTISFKRTLKKYDLEN